MNYTKLLEKYNTPVFLGLTELCKKNVEIGKEYGGSIQ